jgi:hypothetical protein
MQENHDELIIYAFAGALMVVFIILMFWAVIIADISEEELMSSVFSEWLP